MLTFKKGELEDACLRLAYISQKMVWGKAFFLVYSYFLVRFSEYHWMTYGNINKGGWQCNM